MYRNEWTNKDFQQEQMHIMKRLEKAGIKVFIGKRRPQDGMYSGIVGEKRKIIHVG